LGVTTKGRINGGHAAARKNHTEGEEFPVREKDGKELGASLRLYSA